MIDKQKDTLRFLRTTVSYLPVVCVLGIIIGIPFSYGWFQRTLLYAFVVCYLLDYVVNRRWNGWHWTKTKWVYCLMILLFAITPVRQLFDATAPTAYYCHQIDLRYAFLGIGMVGLLGFSDKLRIEYTAYTFLLTGIALFGYMLYGADICSADSWGVFVAKLNRFRVKELHSHMVINLYMNIGIVLGYYVLGKHRGIWASVLTSIGILLLIVCISLSDGRTGFVTMLCVFGVLTLYTMYRWRRYSVIPTLLLVGLAVGWLFTHHQRLDEQRFRGDPRWVVWRYSLDQVNEKPLAGWGLSTLSNSFVEGAYEDEEMNACFMQGVMKCHAFAHVPRTMTFVHPHNAYLALWLEAGFLFPLLYIALLLLPCAICRSERRLYVLLTMFVIAVQSMCEPLGDHLLPLQIALVIWLWLECAEFPAAKVAPTA